jgi:hypothetical protein
MQYLHNYNVHNLFFMRQQIMHFKSKKTPEKRAGV